VPIAADLTTEGAETLTLTLQSKSASITINDTSKSTVQLDTVAPLPTSFTPADGALSVALGSNLAVTFNEPITRGAGTVTLKTAAGSVVETFSATSNRLTVSGSTLTVDPTKSLDIYTRYVLDLGAGAVQDLAGNGSAATSQYDFRTETTDGLYHFFVVAFGAAPGVTYMGQLAEAANFGLSLQEIVEIFTTKSQFTSVYPSSLTNKELAARLVENIVRASATEVTKQSAAADIEAALGLGWSRGKVIYTVFGNLANKPLSDPIWGGTAKQFQNQLAVARYFTETLEGDSTSVGRLQAVLGNVNKDSDVSSSAKVAQLLNQPAYVVSADKSTFDEGAAVIFTVNSYGVAGGTNLSYALSGTNITGSDLSTGTLAGSVTLDSTGTGFITVQLAEDKSTEGTETLNLLLQGSPVKTVSILDTSPTPVDLTPPTVSSIQITGVDSNNVTKSGALVQGNRVKVVLTMSEATAVIGTPSFTIDVGGSTKTAQYASGSGSNALTFYYAVESGDLDNTGGITALANALALPSGSSIKDSAGNSVTLTTAGITTGTNAVSIDAVAPTVRSYSPTPGATNVAIESNFIFTFSEAIKKGTGTILLLDATGRVVESFNVLTSSRLTWASNTLTIDPTYDLEKDSIYKWEIPTGAIEDEVGNDYAGTNTYTVTTVGTDTSF
jgi:methionine-rich copper-binding protein CopC